MPCQGPEAKTTEVEVQVALVCASTDDSRPLIGGTNNMDAQPQVADFGINGNHKRQKFSS